MNRSDRFRSRYISHEDFSDLRRFSDLTRKQDADLLDVAVRTIQNLENDGARIPWMAYRMLRILRDYALPGKAWDGAGLFTGTDSSPPNGRAGMRPTQAILYVSRQVLFKSGNTGLVGPPPPCQAGLDFKYRGSAMNTAYVPVAMAAVKFTTKPATC